MFENERKVGEEFNIPSGLPSILKKFCKAAIRTQPYDLLSWSRAYFQALAEGGEPPIKSRLEYSSRPFFSLTVGFLKILLRQLGDLKDHITKNTILQLWQNLSLNLSELELIWSIGKFDEKCQVQKFVGIALGLVTSSFFEAMIVFCQISTSEPNGGSALIPLSLFLEIYGFLASLDEDFDKRILRKKENLCEEEEEKMAELISMETEDNLMIHSDHLEKGNFQIEKKNGIGPKVPAAQVARVAAWLTECAKIQNGMVGPRNLRHFQCPPLDSIIMAENSPL